MINRFQRLLSTSTCAPQVRRAHAPIKSYLVNGDPDTDAIFRLTHGEAIGGVQLDSRVPPVVSCPG